MKNVWIWSCQKNHYQDYYYKDRNSFEKVCKKTLHITLEIHEIKGTAKKWLDAISGQEIDEFDYLMNPKYSLY